MKMDVLSWITVFASSLSLVGAIVAVIHKLSVDQKTVIHKQSENEKR